VRNSIYIYIRKEKNMYIYDVIDVKRILDKHIVLFPCEKPHTCILWLDVKFVMLF